MHKSARTAEVMTQCVNQKMWQHLDEALELVSSDEALCQKVRMKALQSSDRELLLLSNILSSCSLDTHHSYVYRVRSWLNAFSKNNISVNK
uniref:AlNc14C345G10841 protein n=1 Tax=Albugo laibachii Nc14 TaxID=890382 RepID=F0WX86_9STRA|nr:AlNc14C345G10841 [Albugo laibachii Nc14]|eukprot:CCA26078.1 AlNc14C345G10841 [Albugo laibachii Nc14]